MVLNSLGFAAFFLIFLAVLLIIPKRLRKIWLFLGNCLFLFSWNNWLALLLPLSAIMIWLCGFGIEKQGKRKLFLIFPVLWNAGLLAVFKYAGVLDSLFFRSGISFPVRMSSLAAPIGISFYTLRCISYIADVWRGTLLPVKNPLDVLIYVSFFPQIISGPIERPSRFFTQLTEFQQKSLWQPKIIWKGFLLFVWGLFQKLVLAERLTVISAHYFSDFERFGFWELLAGSLAYTLLIYCDFGGYSNMSRGISTMMGFSTMRNFRQPYFSKGFRDFWHRWHISLSSWLTETIYIPLGGSRKGVLRKYVNTVIVFLISGLWHGSTLNFLFWGLLHALFRIVEDLWNRTGRKLPDWLTRCITFAGVNFAWIFFNSGGLNRGFRIIRQMFSRFTFPTEWDCGLIPGNLIILLIGLLVLAVVDILHERGVGIQERFAALPVPLRWFILLCLFWSVILLGIYGVGYDTTNFIYAQF